MLVHGEINPLNVTGQREFSYLAPHLVAIYFDRRCTELDLKNWIWANLSGRFWMGTVMTDSNDLQACVAFENPAEAGYFSLLLDKINVHDLGNI